MKYVDVFIDSKVNKLDRIFTYSTNNLEVKKGMRIVVPFGRGNSQRIAIVVRVYEDLSKNIKVKEILEVADYEPIINEDLIELGFWMKERYLTTNSQSFSPIFPPGDIKTIKKVATIKNVENIRGEEKKLLAKIKENKYNLDFIAEKEEKNILKTLINKEKIKIAFKLESISAEVVQKFVKLKENYLTILAREDLKLTDKQLLVLEYLQKNKNVLRSEILKDLKISQSPINTLEKKELIEVYDGIVDKDPYLKKYDNDLHTLNIEQYKAYKGILESNKTTNLLYGITGSGKTEIYLKISEKIMEEGGQVIVLVPEIGLTTQMIERFKGRFREKVSVLHSKLSVSERYDQWQKIKNGEVSVVVGARSAVFAPFNNLKLIIIDEEHDNSYRFHQGLKYDTIEVAIKRMEMLGGKVVLGSATPDIVSFYKTQTKEYNLFKLDRRAVKGANPPEIELIDLREELIKGNTSIFSSKLKDLIQDRLNKKEQTILFLNRRGFSKFVSCRSCSEVIKCKNCDVSLTYHKDLNILRCHYCGYTMKMPKKCPICGSKFIKQFGIGTQKVEEEIKRLFPGAVVHRMDSDTTTKKDSYEKIYENVKNNKIDILIGTQMLSKGFDFENVTLVGVIAADLSLYVSDFKASETTFQLLTQVSGRAGRANKKGEVIIQSYTPDNYAIEHSKKGEYLGFYEEEIKLRKLYNYPPFTNLININFTSNEEKELDYYAVKFLKSISKELGGLKVETSRLIKMPKIKNVYKSKLTLKLYGDELIKLNHAINRVLNSLEKEFKNDKIFVYVEYTR